VVPSFLDVMRIILCPYVIAVYCDHTTIRQACFVCQQSIVKKELVVSVLL
jgi:hypothetical protein